MTKEEALAYCAMLEITEHVTIDDDWLYSAIRHAVRNCEFDIAEGGWAPGRYDGTTIAAILQRVVTLAYPP